MSRHARVDQRVMRRTSTFGWRLVRLDGTAVYSDPEKIDTRSSRRLLREVFDIYAPPAMYYRWLPGDDPLWSPPRHVNAATIDGVRLFTDDGQLNLDALKKDGWQQAGAIKED